MKEEISKQIMEADKLIRAGNFEEAQIHVDYILQLEPKNYYARSLQERVRSQLKKTEQKIQQQINSETESMDRKLAAISELLKVAEQYVEEKAYYKALNQVAKVYAIDPYNHFAQVYSTRIDTLIQKDAKERQGSSHPKPATLPKTSPAITTPPKEIIQASKPVQQVQPVGANAQINMYKELLREMWFDGKLSEREQEDLAKARNRLNISLQEHSELEREVKTDAYIEALRIAWIDGTVSTHEKEMLQAMQQKYGISIEEHISVEATILWARNKSTEKKTLLIVDDEKSILLSLAARLSSHGYNVLTAETVKGALQLLEKNMPSLILSDVNFLNSEMDGFEFYNKVRHDEKLKSIPFLFMSSISDELVVRAGLRLGADHFLTKPLNFELLLATIEGKTKA